jgi:exosortase/archaeosortase family protein
MPARPRTVEHASTPHRMGRNRKERRAEAGAAERGSPEETRDAGSGWVASKGPALRFVLVSAGLMALFYAVFYTAPEQSPALDAFIRGYLRAYASTSAFLFGLVGIDARAAGTTLFLDGRAVEVVRGCDAMEPIALYAAAVIAIQVPFGAKLAGLGLGIPMLVGLNVVRIMALALVSAKLPGYFETAHVTVGQTLFVLCTLCLWFAWVLRATRERVARPLAAR